MSRRPADFETVQQAALYGLLGVLLRAVARAEAEDQPGVVTALEFRVEPDGRRLSVDVTVYGAGDVPVAGFSL
ncbi:hypothetical protein Talka_00392 [Tepidimonas alkaliphilus]|uniref:Uncharacterized protein n=1 Tax=Tepidimonas alkaliphilus TaxID=2588942 RepID=A0A554WDR6_9BURK|nr:hypothetical protein [Tepidimonas alkaliphilus]TSE21706.1 hypothetical protein Talka_00386 [Tepidimonas alkaliphilus]TSE21712.1 hypothetical protein Talka_00392 [Tepidimonas alkaliphilus]